jgi:hypothetical protein
LVAEILGSLLLMRTTPVPETKLTKGALNGTWEWLEQDPREHPDTTASHIDVVHNRDLSNWIAQHFGTRHE